MRRYLLAALTAASGVALSSGANAADMDLPSSVYDWSGVYLGVNAGAGWNNSEVDGSLTCSDLGDFCETVFDDLSSDLRHGVDGDDAAFTGGAMIGANWQWESLVLGVEADVNYAGFDASYTRDLSDLANDNIITTNNDIEAYSHADFDANWWGTVRARAGFAVDNWLFYGTGGLAWGTLDASAGIDACWDGCTETASIRGSESDTNVGWTIGAGMEWGWDNWVLGAEYLYVDLGSADFDHRGDLADVAAALPPDVEIEGNANVDYQFSVARVTAKFKF
jgi:outer membrane immunogenic protein